MASEEIRVIYLGDRTKYPGAAKGGYDPFLFQVSLGGAAAREVVVRVAGSLLATELPQGYDPNRYKLELAYWKLRMELRKGSVDSPLVVSSRGVDQLPSETELLKLREELSQASAGP
jgi:hypothetical protein